MLKNGPTVALGGEIEHSRDPFRPLCRVVIDNVAETVLSLLGEGVGRGAVHLSRLKNGMQGNAVSYFL